VSDNAQRLRVALTHYGFAGQYCESNDARGVALSLMGYRWSGDYLRAGTDYPFGWVRRFHDMGDHVYWTGWYHTNNTAIYGPRRGAVMAVLEDLVIEP
jgi:hypothetical protein